MKKRVRRVLARTVSSILSLLLLWTPAYALSENSTKIQSVISELTKRYPNAIIRIVTPEQFLALKSKQPKTVQIEENWFTGGEKLIVAENLEKKTVESDSFNKKKEGKLSHECEKLKKDAETKAEREKRAKCEKAEGEKEKQNIRKRNTNVNVISTGNILVDSKMPDLPPISDMDELALVLFVVIGVLVIGVLVVYAGKYLYDLSMGKKQAYWFELGTNVTFLRSNIMKRGALQGLKFTTGIVEKNIHVGLSAEAGHLNLEFFPENNSSTSQRLKGVYGVLGPSIQWDFSSGINPTYYFMEVLGGTSEHSEMGLLGIARTGLNVGIQKHLRFGFTVGSLYSNLKEYQGLVEENKKYNLTVGLEVGYRF